MNFSYFLEQNQIVFVYHNKQAAKIFQFKFKKYPPVWPAHITIFTLRIHFQCCFSFLSVSFYILNRCLTQFVTESLMLIACYTLLLSLSFAAVCMLPHSTPSDTVSAAAYCCLLSVPCLWQRTKYGNKAKWLLRSATETAIDVRAICATESARNVIGTSLLCTV